jgi:hypothetical protein
MVDRGLSNTKLFPKDELIKVELFPRLSSWGLSLGTLLEIVGFGAFKGILGLLSLSLSVASKSL